MESGYNRKVQDMQKYIPFLEKLIMKLENTKNDKPREAQLQKMQLLHGLLTNKEKRLKLDTLLKCETVLTKLYNKVGKTTTVDLTSENDSTSTNAGLSSNDNKIVPPVERPPATINNDAVSSKGYTEDQRRESRFDLFKRRPTTARSESSRPAASGSKINTFNDFLNLRNNSHSPYRERNSSFERNSVSSESRRENFRVNSPSFRPRSDGKTISFTRRRHEDLDRTSFLAAYSADRHVKNTFEKGVKPPPYEEIVKDYNHGKDHINISRKKYFDHDRPDPRDSRDYQDLDRLNWSRNSPVAEIFDDFPSHSNHGSFDNLRKPVVDFTPRFHTNANFTFSNESLPEFDLRNSSSTNRNIDLTGHPFSTIDARQQRDKNKKYEQETKNRSMETIDKPVFQRLGDKLDISKPENYDNLKIKIPNNKVQKPAVKEAAEDSLKKLHWNFTGLKKNEIPGDIIETVPMDLSSDDEREIINANKNNKINPVENVTESPASPDYRDTGCENTISFEGFQIAPQIVDVLKDVVKTVEQLEMKGPLASSKPEQYKAALENFPTNLFQNPFKSLQKAHSDMERHSECTADLNLSEGSYQLFKNENTRKAQPEQPQRSIDDHVGYTEVSSISTRWIHSVKGIANDTSKNQRMAATTSTVVSKSVSIETLKSPPLSVDILKSPPLSADDLDDLLDEPLKNSSYFSDTTRTSLKSSKTSFTEKIDKFKELNIAHHSVIEKRTETGSFKSKSYHKSLLSSSSKQVGSDFETNSPLPAEPSSCSRLAFKYNPHPRKNSLSDDIKSRDPRMIKNTEIDNKILPRTTLGSNPETVPCQNLDPRLSRSILSNSTKHTNALSLPVDPRLRAKPLDSLFVETGRTYHSQTTCISVDLTQYDTADEIESPDQVSPPQNSAFHKLKPILNDQCERLKYLESKKHKNEPQTYGEYRQAKQTSEIGHNKYILANSQNETSRRSEKEYQRVEPVALHGKSKSEKFTERSERVIEVMSCSEIGSRLEMDRRFLRDPHVKEFAEEIDNDRECRESPLSNTSIHESTGSFQTIDSLRRAGESKYVTSELERNSFDKDREYSLSTTDSKHKDSHFTQTKRDKDANLTSISENSNDPVDNTITSKVDGKHVLEEPFDTLKNDKGRPALENSLLANTLKSDDFDAENNTDANEQEKNLVQSERKTRNSRKALVKIKKCTVDPVKEDSDGHCPVSSTTVSSEEPCSSKHENSKIEENKSSEITKEWLEGFLMNMFNPNLLNKTRVLGMLEKVLEPKKFSQIKDLMEDDDEKKATEQAKESTGSEKPHKKKKSELDKLNEDIRDMFISQGVITATGRRMCTVMTEKKSEELKAKEIATQKQKTLARQKKQKLLAARHSVRKNVVSTAIGIAANSKKIKRKKGPWLSKFGTRKRQIAAKTMPVLQAESGSNDEKDVPIPRLTRQSAARLNVNIVELEDIEQVDALPETGLSKDSSENPVDALKKTKYKPAPKCKQKNRLSDEEEEADSKIVNNFSENLQKASTIFTTDPLRIDSNLIRERKSMFRFFKTKNVHADMHALSVFNAACLLCKYRGRRGLVSHYLSTHKQHEVLISRIPPNRLNELKENIDTKAKTVSLKNVSKGKAFQYQCPFCTEQKSFPRTGWKHHFDMHTGEYSFKCSQCNHLFHDRNCALKHITDKCRNATVLTSTVQHVREVKEIVAYCCDLCNYLQLLEKNMKKHFVNEHGINDREPMSRITLIDFGVGQSVLDASQSVKSTRIRKCKKRKNGVLSGGINSVGNLVEKETVTASKQNQCDVNFVAKAIIPTKEEKERNKVAEGPMEVFLTQNHDELQIDKNFIKFMSEVSFNTDVEPRPRPTKSIADRLTERFQTTTDEPCASPTLSITNDDQNKLTEESECLANLIENHFLNADSETDDIAAIPDLLTLEDELDNFTTKSNTPTIEECINDLAIPLDSVKDTTKVNIIPSKDKNDQSSSIINDLSKRLSCEISLFPLLNAPNQRAENEVPSELSNCEKSDGCETISSVQSLLDNTEKNSVSKSPVNIESIIQIQEDPILISSITSPVQQNSDAVSLIQSSNTNVQEPVLTDAVEFNISVTSSANPIVAETLGSNEIDDDSWEDVETLPHIEKGKDSLVACSTTSTKKNKSIYETLSRLYASIASPKKSVPRKDRRKSILESPLAGPSGIQKTFLKSHERKKEESRSLLKIKLTSETTMKNSETEEENKQTDKVLSEEISCEEALNEASTTKSLSSNESEQTPVLKAATEPEEIDLEYAIEAFLQNKLPIVALANTIELNSDSVVEQQKTQSGNTKLSNETPTDEQPKDASTGKGVEQIVACSSSGDLEAYTSVYRIDKLGYSRRADNSDGPIRYHCLVDPCSFVYSNEPFGLRTHFSSEHSQITWDGYCYDCEANVCVEEGLELDRELKHMLEVHLKSISKQYILEGAKKRDCETIISRPMLKFRRLSGDMLSSFVQSPAVPQPDAIVPNIEDQCPKSIVEPRKLSTNADMNLFTTINESPLIISKVVGGCIIEPNKFPQQLRSTVNLENTTIITKIPTPQEHLKKSTEEQFQPSTTMLKITNVTGGFQLTENNKEVQKYTGDTSQPSDNFIKISQIIGGFQLNLPKDILTTSAKDPLESDLMTVLPSEEPQDSGLSIVPLLQIQSAGNLSTGATSTVINREDAYRAIASAKTTQLKPWTSSVSEKTTEVVGKMLRDVCLFALFKCMGESCYFTTHTAEKMVQHIKYHRDFSNKQTNCKAWLECSYCEFWGANGPVLVKHITDVHETDIFQCPFCFYRSCAEFNVVTHMKIHHNSNEKFILVCSGAKRLLKNEVKEIYAARVKNVRSLQCEECSEEYFIMRSFIEHIVDGHPDSNNYKCHICKRLCVKSSAASHLQIKHSIALYECIYCFFASDLMDHIKIHMANRHPSQLPYVCVRIPKQNKKKIITETIETSTVLVAAIEDVDKNLFRVCQYTKSQLSRMPPMVADWSSRQHMPDKNVNQPLALSLGSGFTISQVQSISGDAFKSGNLHKAVETVEKAAKPVLTYSRATGNFQRPAIPNPDLNISTTFCPATLTMQSPKPLETLWKHLERVARDIVSQTGHATCDLYKCGFDGCNASFKNAVFFNNHLSEHSTVPGAPTYKCYHCRQMMKSAVSLKYHIKSHAIHRYFCYICLRTGSTVHEVMKHLTDAHSDKVSSLTYPLVPGKIDKHNDLFVVCPRGTIMDSKLYGERLQKYWEKQQSMNKKIFTPEEINLLPRQAIFFDEKSCSVCQYKTKVRTNMTRHLQFHKDEISVASMDPINPVPCLETKEKHYDKMINLACSSNAYKDGSAAAACIPQEIPEAKIPKYVADLDRYACGFKNCSYKTHNDVMLKFHINTLHLQEKLYTCAHCDIEICKGRICTEKIMQHLKFHDTKLFVCGCCNYIHYQRHLVDRHILDKHTNLTVNLISFHRDENNLKKTFEAIGSPSSVNSENSSMQLPQPDQAQWECALCKSRSATRGQIVSHMASAHQTKSRFQCTHCSYQNNHAPNVKQHLIERHSSKIAEAKVLFYKVEEKRQANNIDTTPLWRRDSNRVKNIRGILMDEDDIPASVKSQETSQNKPLAGVESHNCHLCGFSGVSNQDLTRHLQTQHGDCLRFLCFQCGNNSRRYRDFDDVREHWRQTHNLHGKSFCFQVSKEFKCSICAVSGSFNALRLHHSLAHKGCKFLPKSSCDATQCEHCKLMELEDPITTNETPNVFTSKLMEYLIKIGNIDYPVQCLRCYESLKNLRSFKRHSTLLHDGKLHYKIRYCRFGCPICTETSTNECSMLRHIKSHPSDFKCNLCPRSYRKVELFDAHLRSCKGNQSSSILAATTNDITDLELIKQMRLLFANGLVVQKGDMKKTTFGDFRFTRSQLLIFKDTELAELAKISNVIVMRERDDNWAANETELSLGSMLKPSSSATATPCASESDHSTSATSVSGKVSRAGINSSVEMSAGVGVKPQPHKARKRRRLNIEDDATGDSSDSISSEDEWKPTKKVPRKRRLSCVKLSTPSAEPCAKTLTNIRKPVTENVSQEYYSFYGKRPEPIDLSKITTVMDIAGVDVPITCDRFAKIYKTQCRVVVKSENILELKQRKAELEKCKEKFETVTGDFVDEAITEN